MDPPLVLAPTSGPSTAAAEEAASSSSRPTDISEPEEPPQQPQQSKPEDDGAWPTQGPWSAWGILAKQKKAVSVLRFSHDGKLLAAACKLYLCPLS